MKTPRFRVGPPIPAAAIAVMVSFLPAFYLLMVVFGKPTFKSFVEGPLWVIVATAPLWLFRRQAIVDRDAQLLRVRWGLWLPFLLVVPLFWRRYRINGSTHIELRTELRGSDKGKTTYYVTRVLPSGIIVAERLGYPSSRRDAERTAEALELPMTDSVGHGASVTRPAKSLSKSLRTRLLDGEVASPEPRRPDWTDLVRRDHHGVMAIDRPAVLRFTVVIPTVLFYVLLNAVVWVEYALGGPATDETATAFFVIAPILGIMGVSAILLAIQQATVRWTVELTDEHLRIRKLSWIVRSSSQMKLSELEEMSVDDCIRVRSDRGQCEFAKDLDPEEREWVGHELLRRMRGA